MKVRIRIRRILISLLFGCGLTLVSLTYRLRLPVVGAEIYRLGFPMYWLQMGRSVLPLPRAWGYRLIWQGLVGDLIFWTCLAFTLMILFASTRALDEKE